MKTDLTTVAVSSLLALTTSAALAETTVESCNREVTFDAPPKAA
ncbi:MAG: iron ABC transporter substrate-binding protein, partial [Shimia sp.]|nr:iron ABC transporter substrate-binding protein [Shimia sp.]